MHTACVSATVLILAILAVADASAQNDPFKPQTTPRTIVLWPDGAPGAVGRTTPTSRP